MAIKRRSDGAGAGAGTGAVDAAADSLWEDAPTEFTRRNVFIHVYGDTGTGRTRFALTAPGPIGLAHAGEKIDGLVEQFARDKVVRLLNFGCVLAGDPQQIADAAAPVWSKLQRGWMHGIAPDGWARTMVMDTDTEAWELLRLSRFGELNPRGRTDSLYGPVNAEWRSLFKAYRAQYRCNVISIGQTKDEYKDVVKNGKRENTRTGRTLRAGQKEMPFMADVVLRTSRYERDDESLGFRITVEKGWWNAHSEGLTLDDEDATFANVMSMITETDAAEWE